MLKVADNQFKVNKQKKNNGCSFFLFAIPISFAIALFLVLIGLVSFFIYDYSKWAKNFESSHLTSDFYTITPDNTKSVNDKIKVFDDDKNSVSTVVFTKEEVFNVVATSLQDNLPSGFSIQKGYIEGANDHWKISLKISYRSKISVWMIYDLEKDKGENIDLFFYDISLGNYSLSQYGLNNLVDDANNGLRDSLKLIENSDFTGKRITNIVMENETITIKGEK